MLASWREGSRRFPEHMPGDIFVKVIFVFIIIILAAARIFWEKSKEQICKALILKTGT